MTIRRALKPTTAASAGRLLSPLAACRNLASRRCRTIGSGPRSTPGHFQTPAVLEIVDRGTGLCDVIVHAGSDLRPPHGHEAVGQFDRRERAGRGAGLGRVGLVRPCVARSCVRRLPCDDDRRLRTAPVKVEVRGRPVMSIQAHARRLDIRFGDRLGESDVTLFHVVDRQGWCGCQTVSLRARRIQGGILSAGDGENGDHRRAELQPPGTCASRIPGTSWSSGNVAAWRHHSRFPRQFLRPGRATMAPDAAQDAQAEPP